MEQQRKESQFKGTIQPLQGSHLDTIKTILETWIRHIDTGEVIHEEVDSVIEGMRSSLTEENNPEKKRYRVAVSPDGVVVGVMGLQKPDKRMFLCRSSKDAKPGELVDAYVDDQYRGQGIARALLEDLESLAKLEGYTELIGNSGGRYEKTGHPAWNALHGPPIMTIENYYGPGSYTKVWRRSL